MASEAPVEATRRASPIRTILAVVGSVGIVVSFWLWNDINNDRDYERSICTLGGATVPCDYRAWDPLYAVVILTALTWIAFWVLGRMRRA